MDTKLKIAMIIERAELMIGPTERGAIELARALANRGHRITILAATGRTNAKNIHVLGSGSAAKKRLWPVNFARIARKHVQEHDYDIIHSTVPLDFADIYQPGGGAYPEAIIRNAASYENKIIEVYKKIGAFGNIRRSLLMRAERKLCKNPNGPLVGAVSKYVAGQFEQHYGLDRRRIATVPAGIKAVCQPDEIETGRLRSQILASLGLESSDKAAFFLFVANNFRRKGLSPLIHALAQATMYHCKKPPYLIIAGRGRSFKYRWLARKLDVADRVVFLGNLRHVPNALSICQGAVLPSFYTPCSRFTLESLACGKPVITTRFNGAADFIQNDRHGIIIDSPKNIGGLAKAIVSYCDESNINRAAQAIKMDRLDRKVSITAAAELMERVYRAVIKRRRA